MTFPGSRFITLAAVLTAGVAASLGAAETAAVAASAPPVINTGDTAWVMVSAAWVLFMTIPGLALFYGGLVRTKNVLTILVQCFAVTALITVLWLLYGYSLCFTDGGALNTVIGGWSKAFLRGVTVDSMSGSDPAHLIPETVFCCFQLTFAIITPALLVGAFAERLRFGVVLAFSALWFTLVYIPICHMAWGGEKTLFALWGLKDLAGGTVVEINSGIAGLVAALVVGRRTGYPHEPMMPHNVVMCLTGGAMLWVGWFGFNAGSAVSANGQAGMAMLTTQIAAAAAALAWMFIEYLKYRKVSALGLVTGAVGGLVAITPACGYVGPGGALVIGATAGAMCWFFISVIKRRAGYDDTLDVFGVHGVGGLIGTLLTGVFCVKWLGGQHDVDMGAQVWAQLKAMAVTIAWSGVGTFAIMKILDLTIGVRAKPAHEFSGLDVSQHGEAAYNH